MTYYRHRDVVQDIAGNAIVGASITVYNAGTLTGATLYSDAIGTPIAGSVVQSGARGEFSFFASAAQYDLSITATGYGTATVSGVWVVAVDGLSPYFDARVLGATGNGSDDDTDALQDGLTAAAAEGMAFYIPSLGAHYVINDELTVPDNVSIIGDGYGSQLRQMTANKNILIAGNYSEIRGLHLKFGVTGVVGVDHTKQHGVYISGKRGVKVVSNYIQIIDNHCGVHLRDSFDYAIERNRIWGAVWDLTLSGGPAAIAAVSSDISIYSLTAGGRGSITGNWCLSNNSQGILFNANGLDTDCDINGNFCITMNVAGTAEEASGGLRRNGLMATYAGSAPARVSVIGNTCRNTQRAGIYIQSNATGAGNGIVVSANTCSRNGYEVASTLAGGIFCSLGGGELIQGNFIHEFQGTGTNAAILISAGGVNTALATVLGNGILSSAGKGIMLVNSARDVQVAHNHIEDSAGIDIEVSQTAAVATAGGHLIADNTCVRTNATSPSMRIDVAASERRTKITGNKLRGFNNATATAANSGIQMATNSLYVSVTHNEIDNFYRGVDFISLFAHDTRYDPARLVDFNDFSNCWQAIGMASGSNDSSTMPLEGNTYVNCTAKVGAGSASGGGGYAIGYEVLRLPGGAYLIRSSAAPTTGCWAVGDLWVNTTPASGQPPGGGCSVASSAGSAGTWVAQANYA